MSTSKILKIGVCILLLFFAVTFGVSAILKEIMYYTNIYMFSIYNKITTNNNVLEEQGLLEGTYSIIFFIIFALLQKSATNKPPSA